MPIWRIGPLLQRFGQFAKSANSANATRSAEFANFGKKGLVEKRRFESRAFGCFGVFSGAVLGCFSGSVVAVSTCKTWDIIRPRLCVSGLYKQLVFMCH